MDTTSHLPDTSAVAEHECDGGRRTGTESVFEAAMRHLTGAGIGFDVVDLGGLDLAA